MNKKQENGRIVPCPGLKITTNAGISFTDSLKRVYDLEREKTHRPKQAATDPRLVGMTLAELRRHIGAGSLYPVLRINARVFLIFDCALTDWRARQLMSLKTGYRRPDSGSRKPQTVPARAA
jgi:hypothetical protein